MCNVWRWCHNLNIQLFTPLWTLLISESYELNFTESFWVKTHESTDAFWVKIVNKSQFLEMLKDDQEKKFNQYLNKSSSDIKDEYSSDILIFK